MPKEARYDVADPKALTDRIAREENEADLAAMDRYVVSPIKRGLTSVKEAIIGTPEQNRKAAAEMKAQDLKNPDSFQAKVNRYLGYGDEAEGKKKGGKVKMKAGGKVSSASKRADGCAQRGKTRGKYL